MMLLVLVLLSTFMVASGVPQSLFSNALHFRSPRAFERTCEPEAGQDFKNNDKIMNVSVLEAGFLWRARVLQPGETLVSALAMSIPQI
jgi:hypothetical protein